MDDGKKVADIEVTAVESSTALARIIPGTVAKDTQVSPSQVAVALETASATRPEKVQRKVKPNEKPVSEEKEDAGGGEENEGGVDDEEGAGEGEGGLAEPPAADDDLPAPEDDDNPFS